MLPRCCFMIIIFRPVWISVSVIMRWCVPIFYLLCVLIARTSITIFRVNIWFFLFVTPRLRLICKWWFLSLLQDFLCLLWGGVIGLLIMNSNKFFAKSWTPDNSMDFVSTKISIIVKVGLVQIFMTNPFYRTAW